MTKQFTVRWALVTVALVLGLFVAHAVAWADILFWKVGWIAWTVGAPSHILLFPTSILPISPGSVLDSPWFFLPACIINIAAWGLVLAWVWFALERRKSANQASHGTLASSRLIANVL